MVIRLVNTLELGSKTQAMAESDRQHTMLEPKFAGGIVFQSVRWNSPHVLPMATTGHHEKGYPNWVVLDQVYR